MADRTYSEREVADLIERAVERQQAARTAETGETLSLAEIERIAGEAGIDPTYLREAAAEMDAVGRTLKRESGQSKTTVFVERWIDAPLTPEAWEDAVITLREGHGADASVWMGKSAGGSVQQIGNAYEWRHTNGLGIQTTVTASPRDGRTRLRITQLVGLASPTVEGIGYGAGIAFFAAMLGAAITGAVTESGGLVALVGIVAFLALWAAAAPLVTALDRRWRDGKLAKLGDLADDLVPILGTVPEGAVRVAAASLAPADPVPTPGAIPEARRLDLDALPDALADEAVRATRRERE